MKTTDAPYSSTPTLLAKRFSDLLRCYYQPSQYPEIALPFVLVRRFMQTTGQTWPGGYERPPQFSDEIESILSVLRFRDVLDDLAERHSLLPVIWAAMADIDLHPGRVNNREMGHIFEEMTGFLFEQARGEHFTPADVSKLAVKLLFNGRQIPETDIDIYDPTSGTGGMLDTAGTYIQQIQPNARPQLYGQEIDPISHALACADWLLHGRPTTCLKLGDTLTTDLFAGRDFDFVLSNPPFGVSWQRVAPVVKKDARFYMGHPRTSDGALLFLQHGLNKLRPNGRMAIILNGSPLFTGQAGSGESEIRRYLLENDLVEGIVALPDNLFQNTAIGTYIWVLGRQKSPQRKGLVQMVDARQFATPMRRNMGEKRSFISDEQMEQIAQLYFDFTETDCCKIMPTTAFGYREITVERPLYGEDGAVITNKKGETVADSDARDTERVPLTQDVGEYFRKEVLPHVPDAWIDHRKTRVGYEIAFNRYFYRYTPPRPLEEITQDLLELEDEISQLQAKLFL